MTKNNQSSLINILKNGNPNNKAIVVPGGYSFSYTEIIENVNYLIKQLITFGIKKNDRIAIYLTNKPETIIAFLAISEIATAAPLNPSYTANEVKFYMEDTNAKYLITSDETNANEALLGCPETASQIIEHFDGKLGKSCNVIFSKQLS